MEDWSHQGSLAAVRLAARHAASLPPPPRSHPTPKRPVKPPPPGGVYTGPRASRVATVRLRLNSNDEEGLLIEIQDERMARRRLEWAAAKQKEAEAIAIELSKPSKWDNIGCAVLKAALLTTVLVDAWWLWQLAEDGGILPRSQDVPPGARVTLADLEKWPKDFAGSDDDFTVGALIISYPWLDADHPDRKGEQLRKIAPVLKIFAEEAKQNGGKVGVFIDYCSLPQRSRASHRAGAAAAEAARAAAKAAGADEEAQDKAAAEAHKSKDDRTPEELATFSAALAKYAPPLLPCALLAVYALCRTLLSH